MSQLKIAIIGYGFVGKACAHIFRNSNPIIIDPLLNTSVDDLDSELDVAMVCVPTPMGENGVINASIVEKVLDSLKAFPDTLVVLKSTMLPNMVARFASENANFIYNPEFLTERNALNDAENPFMTVLGGESTVVNTMEYIYNEYSTCARAPFHKMSAAEAAFVKYSVNSFLSLKVAFWNEMESLISSSECNYDVVRNAVGRDSRIGGSHMMVPGHDGRRGNSGPCFGKDIPALIHHSIDMGKELTILRQAWNTNCDIRNSYPEPLPREKEQNIKFKKI